MILAFRKGSAPCSRSLVPSYPSFLKTFHCSFLDSCWAVTLPIAWASLRLLWPKCFSKPKDRKEELLHSEDDPELQNLRWELRVAFWKPQV